MGHTRRLRRLQLFPATYAISVRHIQPAAFRATGSVAGSLPERLLQVHQQSAPIPCPVVARAIRLRSADNLPVESDCSAGAGQEPGPVGELYWLTRRAL